MPKTYIHGRKNVACCQLIDHLRDIGIGATVGHDNKRNGATLYVYTLKKSDVARVPKEWQEFPVVAKHTGQMSFG